ncbi:short-chain dehydrogenase [Sneathiella sp. P13V-1]|uniref:NnrS family protein n=1 Tax=Sneathiella sp. P13V-1 TaxID=2697366 RepID=UPI00187BA1A6|nr:NnrS family protein [Sneathiella sp. P13V-1]MBE7635922.1 short-chain dehydrogenase [Sneathiella sp. P13V-1]
MPSSRKRDYEGPAILSYGFRVFFLAASLYSGISIVLWLPIFQGLLELNSVFAPVEWHIHEMLFGFVAAVITGFLFTAVPNWTGRLPIRGLPLFALFVIWFVGRIAVAYSDTIGWILAMVFDCLFLTAIWISIAIEIIAGKNWRNLKVLVPLTVLLLANICFHLEVSLYGGADMSPRIALMAVIAFILLIGGRIVPSFTRNWLAKNNPGELPKSFSTYEKVNLAVAVLSMILWVFFPQSNITGLLLLISSALLVGQLSRWVGYRTTQEPLVTVLHISYLFIPIGFSLLALSAFIPDMFLPVTGTHALSAGAIGGMILSVMIRATKGHTGQALTITKADNIILNLVYLSALFRIFSTVLHENSMELLHISSALWAFAFLGFAITYWKSMTQK